MRQQKQRVGETAKNVGEERKTDKIYTCITGYFNFMMNIKLDKRKERDNSGTIGKIEPTKWERVFQMTDV